MCSSKLLKAEGTDETSLQEKSPLPQIFHILPQASTTEPFETKYCEGCSKFCRESGNSCFPLASIYQTQDEYYPYVTCAQRNYYHETLRGCGDCPSNCELCTGTYIRSNLTISVLCNQCDKGYALLKYTKTGVKGHSVECIKCQDKCGSCYFGSSKYGDLNKKNWEGYEESISINYTNAVEAMDAYKAIDNVILRCSECEQSPDSSLIPGLDLKLCETCESQCNNCQYTTFDNSVALEKKKYYPPAKLAQLRA